MPEVTGLDLLEGPCSESHAERLTFSQLCRRLGRSPHYLRNIQIKLGLYSPKETEGFSPAYLHFLGTIIILRAFSVPLEDIGELFEAEKRILRFLRIDTLTLSPTWYLDQCGRNEESANRLLLTNQDLGGSITEGGVQFHLDFRGMHGELFSGAEMGQDAKRVMAAYDTRLEKVRGRVKTEEVVLRRALAWSDRWET
ncbi:MAG: hypothetical protein WCS52_14900 [bacterium]